MNALVCTESGCFQIMPLHYLSSPVVTSVHSLNVSNPAITQINVFISSQVCPTDDI